MDLGSYSGIVVAKGAYFAVMGSDLQIGSKMVHPPSEDAAHVGAIGLASEPLAW